MRWLPLSPVVAFAACASPHPSPRHPTQPVDVAIAPAAAEVWGFEADVGGALRGPVAGCRVRVGAREVTAITTSGRWSARIPLATGDNPVVATCVDAGGREHPSPTAHLRGMLRDTPIPRVHLAREAADLLLDASPSTPSDGSHAPIASFRWDAPEGAAIAADGPRARVTSIPSTDAHVRLHVTDAAGASDEIDLPIGPPRPFRDDVLYGVVPRLFGAEPLRAVTASLDDLADLGVTVLWLSPIFETLPHEYGYAVLDYFRVRPDYGTEADLVALVREAHARRMRVILDFVPNHTSSKHRYFLDAAAHGPASHYFDFYQRDPSGNPVHYFDWEHLPNLELHDAEVARWLTEAAKHWIRAAAVDGYRFDAAWGIEQRTPSYWDALREELRSTRPEALLVAEASARDPFWDAHGFDAAYDWTDELGHWAWENVFADADAIADRLDAAVRAAPSHVVRFLENNDTGERFVTKHGPGLTRVAAAALLTLPGTPALFTGQERGAEYEPYARLDPIRRDDPDQLRPWYRALVAARRSSRALRDGTYERLPTSDRRVLAFARSDGTETVLVVLRFDASPAHVRLRIPDSSSGPFRDALRGRTFRQRGGMLDVDVDGWGALVLAPDRPGARSQ